MKQIPQVLVGVVVMVSLLCHVDGGTPRLMAKGGKGRIMRCGI